MSKNGKRTLVLFGEVFADGGIQRFNRTFMTACERINLPCDVFTLHDTATLAEQSWPKHPDLTVHAFARNKVKFITAVLKAVASGRYGAVVIGHIHMLHLAVAACAMRAFRDVRLLLITHGIEVWSGVRNMRRRSLGAVDTILCVSDYTRQMMRQQAPELEEARFTIFPNALSETWLQRQAQAERAAEVAASVVPPGRFILSVARLSRHDRMKGIVSVIEALPMLRDRDINYVIAGQGDDMDFLRQAAERCGVTSRVRFMGSVSDAMLVDLYRRCEAFVLPSGQEGFGIVFLEAMYFDAPVIAARAKGAVDVVQDGETGLLVAFGDVMGLKLAIDRLLADASLRESLRKRARQNVTGHGPFTFQAFVQRCGALLRAGE